MESHLLQMRGLKLQLFFNLNHLSVVPYIGTWIETSIRSDTDDK